MAVILNQPRGEDKADEGEKDARHCLKRFHRDFVKEAPPGDDAEKGRRHACDDHFPLRARCQPIPVESGQRRSVNDEPDGIYEERDYGIGPHKTLRGDVGLREKGGAEGPLMSREPAEEDRKSTRLNSSHSQISYAVL